MCLRGAPSVSMVTEVHEESNMAGETVKIESQIRDPDLDETIIKDLVSIALIIRVSG